MMAVARSRSLMAAASVAPTATSAAILARKAWSTWTVSARLGATAAAPMSALMGAVHCQLPIAVTSPSPAQPPFGIYAGSTIDFGTNGGTLTTKSLFASPTQLMGTGIINASGLVSDMDLRFDLTHGLNRTLTFQDPGQNVTVNLALSNASDLGVGWKSHGSLTIEGTQVTSYAGYLGYNEGASGVATISGTGSIWTTGATHVGFNGSGSLSITNGGSAVGVHDIGYNSGSTGVVTVDGCRLDVACQFRNLSRHLCRLLRQRDALDHQWRQRQQHAGYIGSVSGSTGVVTVDGAGSTWIAVRRPRCRQRRQRDALDHQWRQRQQFQRRHWPRFRLDGRGHGGRRRLDLD